MKGTTWVVVALLMMMGMGTGTADAATRARTRSSVAATARPVDLALHDSGGYAALRTDAGIADAAWNLRDSDGDEMTAGQPATHLGYPLNRQVSIGLDFRHDAPDESDAQAVVDGDVEEYLTRNLVLGFHYKF